MASGEGRNYPERKQALMKKINDCLGNYERALIVHADNVGSKQFQNIRAALRGKANILMGKNTIVRLALTRAIEAGNKKLETLLPLVKGNVGIVFTNGDLGDIKTVIEANRVQAPARAGAIAQVDVFVPAQNTGLEPTKTSFFQALNIPTKIAKGAVEILQDVHLIHEGTKVGSSEAALLKMLNINPFFYGLELLTVWEGGNTYSAKILAVKEEELLTSFKNAAANVRNISLAVGFPTVLSVPVSLARGFKNILSISLATEYKIAAAEKMADAALNAPAPSNDDEAPLNRGKDDKKKEEVKEESEDEEMGFSLFGDD
jgi:large subunit ribosomal protein LP0